MMFQSYEWWPIKIHQFQIQYVDLSKLMDTKFLQLTNFGILMKTIDKFNNHNNNIIYIDLIYNGKENK